MTRRAAWIACVAVVLALSGCAKKPAIVPAATAPHYPDFVFPVAPQGLAPAAVLDQHDVAWQLLQGGDTRGAERAYTAALRQAPAFYPAEAGLGYAALARKDAAAALAHFDRALARNGTYAPALAGKGDALLAQGKTDLALQAFEAAVAADPSLPGLKSRVDVLKFRSIQQQIGAARKAAESGQTAEARRAYEAAIAASPESAFLYRELAAVERKAGDTNSALAHAEQAARLDPGDARSLILVGEIYEADRQWSKAADAYAAAAALDPSDETAARVDAMREKAAFDTMPDEYRSIESAPAITRAQLAALIGVRLGDLLRRARPAAGVVVTDTRSNWAAPWILLVMRAGVMDPYPNHTFHPSGTVRRADLAAAVSRVLTMIGAEKPRLAARWRDPRPRFSDLSPGHLSYPAAARSVSSGVLDMLDNNSFQLTRPVSGQEALTAVQRLEALAKRSGK